MVESGKITRSTDECEMSRSCQRATFFKRRLGVAAQHAREAADLLAGDGVLLVRHGRGALLLFAEVLLRLAHLGALQVADLDGDLVERAADNRQRGDVGGVAVALDDLRGDGRGLEAEPRADAFFVLGLEMAEGADRAGELAHAHVFGGGIEAGEVALHLGVPVEQLEAEGRRLGVDAVGAADGRRVLELESAALEHGEERDAGPLRMSPEASLTCRACAVSTMSFEVRP